MLLFSVSFEDKQTSILANVFNSSWDEGTPIQYSDSPSIVIGDPTPAKGTFRILFTSISRPEFVPPVHPVGLPGKH